MLLIGLFYIYLFLIVICTHINVYSGGAELLFDKVKKHNVELPASEKKCKSDVYLIYTLKKRDDISSKFHKELIVQIVLPKYK